MPFPTFAAGQTLTAALLTSMQWNQVSQGTAQIVNNSIAFVDSSIVIPATAGGIYLYALTVSYATATAAGARFEWTVPTSGNIDRFIASPGMAATGGPDDWTTSQLRRQVAGSDVLVAGAGTAIAAAYFEFGELDGGDGGSATFRFAQQTANATDTTLQGVSAVYYVRVG